MIRSAHLRLRYLLARHGSRIAIALLLVGVASLGSAGWLYAHPPTTEVTDRTNERTIRSEISTRGTPTGATDLYGGERTVRNLPVYLVASMPTPVVEQTTSVPPGQPVDVDQRLVLTYRAVRDDETFWNESTTLERTRTTTTTGSVRTRTTLDVGAIESRRTELQQTVGEAGTVHVALRLEVAYETRRYRGNLSEPVEFQLGDGWYHIEAATAERTHSTPVTRTVPVPTHGVQPSAVLGGLGAVVLLAGVGVARATRTGSEPAATTRELHRLRYAEWISRGSLRTTSGENVVVVASLEELVDVAIDTGSRVIHDVDADRYAVVDGATVYYYDPFWDP